MKKGIEESLSSLNPDIIVLQETKLSEDDPSSFPYKPDGYDLYHTISKWIKGYSGVAILSKIKPLNVHYGLNNGEYDNEGRIITLEFDSFFLVGVYVPNSGDGLKRLGFRMEFEDRLKEYLLGLDARKPIVYTGDLNVAHKEIDIKNPKANEMNAGYTIEERTKFGGLLDSGFIDTFRFKYPDMVKYSWWSYRFHARENNAGWRIDYFLVSKRIIDKVSDSKIHNEIYGSDHCPIELDIEL